MWPEKAGLERYLNRRADYLGDLLEIERKEEEGGVESDSKLWISGNWVDADDTD